MSWKIIENHTAPEEKEPDKIHKNHVKKIEHVGMDTMLRQEGFQDPASASTDCTSYSKTPISPRDTSQCTIFTKIWLDLTFVDWRVTVIESNKK